MKTKALVLALALLLVAYALAFAQEDEPPRPGTLILTDEQDKYPLGLHLEILEDPSGELAIEDVASPAFDSRFVPSQSEVPNYGYTDSVYWVRLNLRNETRLTDRWLLEAGPTNMQFVDLYTPLASGEGFAVRRTGALRSPASRDIRHPRMALNLDIPANSQQLIYVRFQSGSAMRLPLTLWLPDAFWIQSQLDQVLRGSFFGAMLVLLATNLFLLLSVRERSYLYLVILLASMIIFEAGFSGYTDIYILPRLYSLRLYFQAFSFALVFVSMLLFTDAFLELKARIPKLHWVTIATVGVWGVLILLTPFSRYRIVTSLMVPWALPSLSVVLAAGTYSWLRGFPYARLFMFAWAVLLATFFFSILIRLGAISSTIPGEDVYRLGIVWMAVCWSLALADRINLLRAETEQANRELRASEDRLTQVLEAMPVGVVVYGADQKPWLVNRQSVEVLSNPERGVGPDPTMSRTVAESAAYYSFRVAGSEQAYPLERNPLMRALGGEHAEVDDLEIDLVDERRSLEVWASPIYDARGNVQYAVAAFQDITRRKQAEAELRKHREHLGELVASRTAELSQANQLLQAEIAERTRAEEALGRHVAELSMLNHIAQALATVTDLPQALDLVTESVTYLFGAYAAFIGQLDAAQTELTVLSQSSHDCGLPELISLPVGSTGEANLREELLRGRTQVIQTAMQGLFPSPMGEHLSACDIQTLMLVPLRVREATIGVLCLETAGLKRVFNSNEISLAETIAANLAAALENARLFEQAGAAAAAEERNRIARDLHDSVTQVLFSANLVAELLPGIWRRDPEKALQSLDNLRRFTRGALAEMRTMLLELRPATLIKTPLGELLGQLTEAVTIRADLPFQLSIEKIPSLPEDVQANFYRIAQEALNNVVKHAQANLVTVSLDATPLTPDSTGVSGHEVKLVIQDDGVGYATGEIQPDRMGIGIMHERAAAIHATLSVESQPKHGTRVTLIWRNK